MKKVWFFGILTVLFSISLVFMTHHKAYAAYDPNDPNCNSQGTFFTRPICNTFYYNYTPTNSPSFPSWTWPNSYTGTNDAAGFIRFMRAGLFYCDYTKYSAGSCNRVQLLTAIGESMIIETMLGKGSPGGSNPSNAGIATARNDINIWSGLITDYDNAHRINWDSVINYNDPSLTNCNNGVGRTDTLAINQGLILDVDTYCNNTAVNSHYIVFRNQDGSFYRINRLCGNVTGSATKLAHLNDPPIIGVSNISCNSTQFNVLSSDTDSGTPLSTYPIKWRMEYWNGTSYVAVGNGTGAGAWHETGNSYGTQYSPGRTFTMPAYNQSSKLRIRAYTVGAGSPIPTNGYSNSWGPCAPAGAVSCDYSNIPLDIEANQAFSLTMKVNFNPVLGSPPTSPSFTWSSNAPLHLTPTPPHAPSPAATGSSASLTLTSTGTTAGAYTFNWSFTSSAGPATCVSNITVASKPYYQVYSGDVMTGSGFGDSNNCSLNNQAQILGFNKNGTPDYSGSGTELASFAMDAIDGFASARSQGANIPKTLSFANADANDSYGGNFGSAFCIPDYFSAPVSASTILSSCTNIGQGVAAATCAGPWLGLTGQHVNKVSGQNVIIQATGTAISLSSTSTDWASPSTIPNYWVIVKGGDIYIDHNVTSMAAVLIAEPDSNGVGGNIYDCTNLGSRFSASTLYDNCLGRLTLNGALVANKVWLLRTYGTLNQASLADISSSNNAAEIINFSPATWLNSPFQNTSTSVYKAEVGLPPIL